MFRVLKNDSCSLEAICLKDECMVRWSMYACKKIRAMACCTLSKDINTPLISLSSPISRLPFLVLYSHGDIGRGTMKGYVEDLRFNLAIQAVPPRQ